MKAFAVALLGASMTWGAPAAIAQGKTNAPKELSTSPSATLYRVDEGIFDIKEGQSIDLTDRKVLMAFRRLSEGVEKEWFAERQQVRVYFNGRDFTFYQGMRLDLKSNANIVPKLFADKSECYLDLVGTTAPKGGTRVATFRFVCH